MKILASVIMYVFSVIGTMADIILLLAIVFAIASLLVWVPDVSFNSDLLRDDLQNSLEIVYLKLQLAAHRYLR